MEYFISFLKSSSILDFAIVFLAISVGVVLIVAGVVMLFAAKTRRFFFVYLAMASLPLILGMAGAGARWYRNESLLKMNEIDPSSKQAAEIRANMFPDYVITVLIGAGATSLPVLIGIAGVILKKSGQTRAIA